MTWFGKFSVSYVTHIWQCSTLAEPTGPTATFHIIRIHLHTVVVCMWDTIAHMDEYCSSSGYNVSSDYLSKGSRNEGDSKQYFNLNMTKNFDIDSGTTKESSFTGCNLHAFCYACVEEDGGAKQARELLCGDIVRGDIGFVHLN